MLCAFKAGFNALFALPRWILLHEDQISSWFKLNLATFSHFLPQFLCLFLLGPKLSGPSGLNDERQNLPLCTSAMVLMRLNKPCVRVLSLYYRCLMVRLKGSDEDSITTACCCSQPMATHSPTHPTHANRQHTPSHQHRSIHCHIITHTHFI